MIGILLALALQSPVECKIVNVANPVALVCSNGPEWRIPLSEWPLGAWGGPALGGVYQMDAREIPLPKVGSEVKQVQLPHWDIQRERFQRQPMQNDFPTRPDN